MPSRKQSGRLFLVKRGECFARAVQIAKQYASNHGTPTRKSPWSSTPHRDFSIECYKVAKKTPDGIDYEITIDGKNGYATVAMTKYYDGTEEPTLPINLGTHSIYFYAE